MKTALKADRNKFSALVPKLRDRYLAKHNVRIAGVLADPKKTESERFWDALQEMEKQAKVLQLCLDGHSRSKLWLFMISMLRYDMRSRDAFALFSDELRSELADVFDETEASQESELAVGLCPTVAHF
ncbi:MAG: hypothetical protein ABIO94_09190 [Opitutaceae bacterium]